MMFYFSTKEENNKDSTNAHRLPGSKSSSISIKSFMRKFKDSFRFGNRFEGRLNISNDKKTKIDDKIKRALWFEMGVIF